MPDYYVAFWNLENLFDINNSPRRSEKLQRTLKSELSKWTTPVLNRKIQQLASIIRQMNHGYAAPISSESAKLKMIMSCDCYLTP